MEENSNNDTISKLQEIGLTQTQIDDLMPLLEKKAPPEEGVGPSSVEELRNIMLTETDYIKRAQLAARIISISLEEGY